MNTAEIAVLISIISVSIAAFSLGWNVYRDVVLKARVVIQFGVRTIIQEGNPDRPRYVMISATNHGPGTVNLSMIEIRDTSLWKRIFKKRQFAVVTHDYTNPISGQLPHKLEAGEKIDILLPYNSDCFLKQGWSHVGLNDYYGRTHWASPKQVKTANERWANDFKTT